MLKFIPGETVPENLLRIAIDLPKFRRSWFSQSSLTSRCETLNGQPASYPLIFSAFFPKDGHTIDFSTSRKHSTDQCHLLHRCITPHFSLLLFRFVAFHYMTTWNLLRRSFFFKVFSAKQKKKKATEKRSHYSVIEQNALSDNLWKILQNVRIQKWPAMRRELDRSSPRSGRTLSIDRPLSIEPCTIMRSLWMQRFTQFTQLFLLCNFGKIEFLRRGRHYTHIALSWMHRQPKLTSRGKGVM